MSGSTFLGVDRKKLLSILLVVGICCMFAMFFINRALLHLAKHYDGEYYSFFGNARQPFFTIFFIILYMANLFGMFYIAKIHKQRQCWLVILIVNALLGLLALAFLVIIAVIGIMKLVDGEEKWFVVAFHGITLTPLLIMHFLIVFLIWQIYRRTPVNT